MPLRHQQQRTGQASGYPQQQQHQQQQQLQHQQQQQQQHQQGQYSGGGRGNSPISPLEDLMRRKGVDEAWDALEEMQRAGLPTDRFTMSRMLMRTLADARRYWDPSKIQRSVALVERFLQQQPEEADEVLFNALLDTHCRMKDVAGLESTFKTMQELSIEPSHVTLGILVKAYGQACDIKSVLRLWEEMEEQREQANAVTYGCMINACVRCGQTEKAVEIFDEMKALKKHCNTILYTTLIKGYGNEKDLPSALALFREMREENVPYNTIAYNSIIDVCIKCSDVQSAEEIFREMLAPNSTVQPDLITYSTLLKGYCQIGNLDKALQVAETIKACGLKCDELVYNTLMDGCVKANDLSAGVGLFAEMMASGMKPSSITHSIFLRLYQRNGYKGTAGDAVAQLYQHHGLERPQSLEKPTRGKGAKGKVGRNMGGGSSSSGYDNRPSQQMPMMHGGHGPLPPGYLTQAGMSGMPLPRESMMGQAPPGRWNHGAPPSTLLDGLGAGPMGGAPPAGHGHYVGPPMPSRGQAEAQYGILSSPSTYGGMSMERSAPMFSTQAMPPRGHMPMDPQMAYGNMSAPMSYQQQGYMAGTAPGHYGGPGGYPLDAYDSPFPSLLVQQRQQEEYMERFYPDARNPPMGMPHGAAMGRKHLSADGGY